MQPVILVREIFPNIKSSVLSEGALWLRAVGNEYGTSLASVSLVHLCQKVGVHQSRNWMSGFFNFFINSCDWTALRSSPPSPWRWVLRGHAPNCSLFSQVRFWGFLLSHCSYVLLNCFTCVIHMNAEHSSALRFGWGFKSFCILKCLFIKKKCT